VKVGLVRADSGFYTDEILSALEDRDLKYIIAARAYANLRNEIHGMKDWVEGCPGIAVIANRKTHFRIEQMEAV
jgi:hypothetical protein